MILKAMRETQLKLTSIKKLAADTSGNFKAWSGTEQTDSNDHKTILLF